MIKTASLTPEAVAVILYKGTEAPFTGCYTDWDQTGTYLCRQCGLALFRSQTQFHSGCGWVSFDDEVPGALAHKMDADDRRTEITCARCGGHLGHIFVGESFTAKNKRYCVNSLSLDFVADTEVKETEEAIFGGGCFWGVESLLQQCPHVLKTEVGYTGGETRNPTYRSVCEGGTGHIEAVRVIYDPQKISFEQLARYFFEIHNPTEADGQGPDRGSQYISVIFYYDASQQAVSKQLIQQLEKKGYRVATKLAPVSVFWRAEEEHQNYYQKHGQKPYCHVYEKRW